MIASPAVPGASKVADAANADVAAEWLPVIVERLVREFQPLRIVLFDSHARGDARSDSDVDLLVVLPHVDHQRRATIAMLRALRDLPIASSRLSRLAAKGSLFPLPDSMSPASLSLRVSANVCFTARLAGAAPQIVDSAQQTPSTTTKKHDSAKQASPGHPAFIRDVIPAAR